MVEGTEAYNMILEYVKYIFIVLFGFFGSLIKWHIKRQVGRVDAIEGDYVSVNKLNETINTLRELQKSGQNEIVKRLDSLSGDIKGTHQRIDNIIDKR